MPASAFDLSALSPDAPVTFGPLAVTLAQDCDTTNPFTDGDGYCPALYRVGGALESVGEDIADPLHNVSAVWVSARWRAIAEALGLEPAAHDAEARDRAAGWSCSLSEARRDLFAERLRDLADDAGGWYACGGSRYVADYFDALVALYALRGIPALHAVRHGYCQGDVASILLVWTPAFAARTGATATGDAAERDMAAQADTLAHWFWGDCWFWTVERDGDVVDSCGGYVGPSDCTYMLGEARTALRHAWSDVLGDALASISTAATFAAGPYAPAA